MPTCRWTRGSSWPRSATRSTATCCATRLPPRRSRRFSGPSSPSRRSVPGPGIGRRPSIVRDPARVSTLTRAADPDMRRRDDLAAASLDNGSGIAARFLDNGALFGLHAGDVMVNLVLGSPMGGALGNLFLRSFDRDGVTWTPLIGPRAPGRFFVGPDSARWLGRWQDIEYACSFELDPADTAWAWRCRLTNRSGRRRNLDLVLAQDVGLGHEAHVRTNELYTSQYIDHTVLRHPSLGYVVCSRQ